jgi:diaminopimelate decarboxylase
MDHFEYRDGRLHAEDVPVADIAATVGTPCYIYSRATIERHWRAFDHALSVSIRIWFATRSRPTATLAVLNVLARLGSGFDIVSGGELERVLAAGGDPGKIVFSGVGKRRDELERALEMDIRCFNIESEAELALLERVAAERGQRAPVSLRINPDVDADTHPISPPDSSRTSLASRWSGRWRFTRGPPPRRIWKSLAWIAISVRS